MRFWNTSDSFRPLTSKKKWKIWYRRYILYLHGATITLHEIKFTCGQLTLFFKKKKKRWFRTTSADFFKLLRLGVFDRFTGLKKIRERRMEWKNFLQRRFLYTSLSSERIAFQKKKNIWWENDCNRLGLRYQKSKI